MRLTLLCVVFATAAMAGTVTPVSYSMPNGQGQANGGSLNYWDDTYSGSGNKTSDGAALSGGLGQLTDGIVGGNDWMTDFGDGAAYRWVAWRTLNPTITFDFGSSLQFNQIRVHSNNSQTGGVSLWTTMDVSFSNDGVNFGNSSTRTTTAGERADTTARYIDTALNGAGRYLRITVNDGGSASWIFLSEVQFDADNGVIPEPGTAGLVLSAGLFALWLRRRRART